eukprot:scaffold257794_cov29-Prasinocladus_malaysianus.AAC.1
MTVPEGLMLYTIRYSLLCRICSSRGLGTGEGRREGSLRAGRRCQHGRDRDRGGRDRQAVAVRGRRHQRGQCAGRGPAEDIRGQRTAA